MNFIDRKDAGTLEKKAPLRAPWTKENLFSSGVFREEKMESINERKCHHMAFFKMRLLKIDLILI